MIRPPTSGKQNPYAAYYAAMRALRARVKAMALAMYLIYASTFAAHPQFVTGSEGHVKSNKGALGEAVGRRGLDGMQ